ncbi:MAG: penicillin-binding transpeptidase domain-containing protein, partial [Lacrimispora sp.]
VGTSWRKDASWGNYYITTLHTYEPVILKNALIYSDNIYFAKAALSIGADVFTEQLKSLGFGERIPFPIEMGVSSYSNNDKIDDEIQLADSGYGQGELLVNPLHLAVLYSAFVNDGNVISPTLRVSKDQQSSFWIENAFSKEAADTVREDLIQVIEDKNGTGHGCKIDGLSLAGKTGTAEIKQSKEDQDGTELGWFAVFTPDAQGEDAFLMLTMVEDVKERGGSGYVVERTRKVLENK